MTDIRKIVDQYHQLQDSLRQWIEDELDPLLLECKTVEAVRELKRDTVQQFGGNDVDGRLPLTVYVHFAIYIGSLIEEPGEAASG